jgi:hypothetical protein
MPGGLSWLGNGHESVHLWIRHQHVAGTGLRCQHAAHRLDDCGYAGRQQSRRRSSFGQDWDRAVVWRFAAAVASASPLSMAGGSNDDPRSLGIDAVALELRWHRQSTSANRSSRHASPDRRSWHTGRKLLGHSFGSKRYHCAGASAGYRSTHSELIRLMM